MKWIIFLLGCLFSMGAAEGPSFEDIILQFDERLAWGIETMVDLHDCDPQLIRSPVAIKQYVRELCELIDMKRFRETVVVHFGDFPEIEGYSFLQLIETSLVSGHAADATNALYINIFSCKLYNPYVVAQFTKDFFKGSDIRIHIQLRI